MDWKKELNMFAFVADVETFWLSNDIVDGIRGDLDLAL